MELALVVRRTGCADATERQVILCVAPKRFIPAHATAERGLWHALLLRATVTEITSVQQTIEV